MAWQPEIFENLDRCRKVVAMFSPQYLKSKMCKEEFNIAWVRGRKADEDILFPVYLYSADLPTYMTYRNYADCREGDLTRIGSACDLLFLALTAPHRLRSSFGRASPERTIGRTSRHRAHRRFENFIF